MDPSLKFYGEITMVEPPGDGPVKVIGVASAGAIDDANERMLPEATKAALPAYMRFGALREMHGLSAPSATLSAEADKNRPTRIEALMFDPVAVSNVWLGAYETFIANLIPSSGLVKLEHGQGSGQGAGRPRRGRDADDHRLVAGLDRDNHCAEQARVRRHGAVSESCFRPAATRRAAPDAREFAV